MERERAKAFLDSTVILRRKFGRSSEIQNISNSIEGLAKFSSEYTKMEIWRTFLKDAVYLHSILSESDLPEVLFRISALNIPPRVKTRCLELLANVSDRYSLRAEDARARLESLIEGMEVILFSDITLLKSGTCCALASEEIHKAPSGYVLNTRCTRQEPVCKIVEFLEQNEISIKLLHSSLKEYLKGVGNVDLQRLNDLLSVMNKRGPTIAKGRNCKILGDTLICLDAPDEYEIFSTNKKDFRPICSILQKKFKPI